jgi:hypothetical protein
VQRGHLLRIVISATAIRVSNAKVAGLALSFAMNGIIACSVESNSFDAITPVAGTLLLAAISEFVFLFPALRFSYIDPMAALRLD